MSFVPLCQGEGATTRDRDKMRRIQVIGIELIYRRAGCPPDSQQMKDLLTALSKSDAVETFGFYSRMSLVFPFSPSS